MKALVFDAEIIKCLPDKGKERNPALQYAEWGQFDKMGVSVAVAFSTADKSYHVFMEDNLSSLTDMAAEHDYIVGFNSKNFDDPLMAANNVTINTNYDIIEAIKEAANQPLNYVRGVTRAGYTLDRIAEVNLGYKKSGSGALAPALWQQGQYGYVISYCIQDVKLTKDIMRLIHNKGELIDPTTGEVIKVKGIAEWIATRPKPPAVEQLDMFDGVGNDPAKKDGYPNN